ncbi:hypothetical protein BaRGS_00010448 [Batillaria attramentaria]|uniref:Uncharacterized protein n=1 Tax=Batillaria attramentaria TaxID=370345 RepID=A0ABD0LFJ0_9CAEN
METADGGVLCERKHAHRKSVLITVAAATLTDEKSNNRKQMQAICGISKTNNHSPESSFLLTNDQPAQAAIRSDRLAVLTPIFAGVQMPDSRSPAGIYFGLLQINKLVFLLTSVVDSTVPRKGTKRVHLNLTS